MLLPLASATGYATIVGSVSFAGLFVWWLLRTETGDSDEQRAEEQAALDGEADRLPEA